MLYLPSEGIAVTQACCRIASGEASDWEVRMTPRGWATSRLAVPVESATDRHLLHPLLSAQMIPHPRLSLMPPSFEAHRLVIGVAQTLGLTEDGNAPAFSYSEQTGLILKAQVSVISFVLPSARVIA